MNKKRYTHVFWDWNGTIVDDLSINFDVINTLLKNRGKTTVSMIEYRNAFSFPIKTFYEKIGLPINGKEYERLVSDYWRLYKSNFNDIPLMEGVSDILFTLKKNNVNQYILSASNKEMIFDQLSLYGIQDYFEDIIAPYDGYALGKIELAKQWISNHKISVSSVIMIGDTFHDYETAKAINIDCVLVDKGHQNLKSVIHNPNFSVYNDIVELQ